MLGFGVPVPSAAGCMDNCLDPFFLTGEMGGFRIGLKAVDTSVDNTGQRN